jgi:putative phage-type endonuclease
MSEIVQGSSEWFALRNGKVSASRINDMLAKTKSGWSTSRENYMYELAIERLTGQKTETFTSGAMLHGVENEPLARSAYQVKKNIFVTETAWVNHFSVKNSGCSPDGLVDDGRGLIEIKCPLTKNHIKWMIDGVPPKEHCNQMFWQMAVTGRHYCDFVSFDPRLPEDLQLFVVRLERDDKYIEMLTDEVAKFEEEVTMLVTKLKELRK